MLSSAAFNAFLKTLEEPPAYAKFILATTEKHKIIPTILSRCQIFDFKRIGIDDIAKHLAFIAGNENVQAEPDALHIIAQKADGALRDALSIFDQIVSFSGGDITYKSVIENLNVLDYDYYFRIIDSILGGDITNCLLIINDIIDNGFDGQHFIIGMGEHLRNLMVCKDAATLKLLEVGDNIKEKYASQSTTCDINFLLEALDINNRCDIAYKNSNNKRLHLELSLMQMCSIGDGENKKHTPTPIKLKKPEKVAKPLKTIEPEKISEADNVKPEPVATPIPTPAPIPTVTEEVAVASEPKETIPPAETSKPKYTVPSIKEEIKAESKPRTNIPGSFSIKGFAKKEEEKKNAENEEIDYANMPKEAFDLKKLEGVWNTYLESLKPTLPGFSSALLKYKPVLKDDFIIEFQIDNKIIANDHINISELQSHLKKELNNYSLSIHPLIVEKQEQKSIYTDQDKFKKMAEKNPNVLELKQKLDLEIDF
jgi:DNA polymerase-3 subunit gamma/tau